ncbi:MULTISPECIES: ATP-binding protein [unclassified Streptomyces]|uniref:ATP-binding protein n=1 Tax=unclassified Streptomyces TaxID=2593676 RepID=UPI001BE6553E|nr:MULTISPECIES: ATP-binding protein [unclassified Streptomyces]MBT2403630.1 ATP-binding protein [Streptomyces sp. ISL-21]MBT2456299.1 ATP-binding protein [Streptomyces sp. ISL-86]MBT2609831.1 ATP-binding protein [Streptomyces sp. ISL-87]
MATLSHVNQEICLVATLPSTPRGARAARTLTVSQLAEQRLPFEDAAQVVAELAANAVTHGRVRGRDFRLALRITPGPTLRIEVSDTRREFGPPAVADAPDSGAESGRGLVLVSALATRWGTDPGPAPLKTVWAEMDLGSPISPDRGFHDPVGR